VVRVVPRETAGSITNAGCWRNQHRPPSVPQGTWTSAPPPTSCESRGIVSSLVCLLNRWRWVQSTRGSSCESVTRRCAKAWRGSSRLQRSEAIGARSELSKQGLCPRAYRCCRSRSTTSCPKKPAVSKEHAGQRGLARTLRGHARIGARSAAHQVGKTWEIARPSLTTAVHSGVYRSARFDRGKALWTAHALLLSRGAKHVVVLAKPEHSPSGNRGERRR